MVVDDDDDFRRLVVDFLTMDGYLTIEAADAHAALSIFQQQRETIDLVLTDIQMPGGGGLALAREIEKLNHPTTILFMSAAPGDCQASVSILEKPFAKNELKRRVESALASHRGS